MNVNIIDDEKAAKNVELRKEKKDYKPYADDTIDEYGIVCQIMGFLTLNLSFCLWDHLWDQTDYKNESVNLNLTLSTYINCHGAL